MRTAILIDIDDNSLKKQGYTYKEILNKTLDKLSDLYSDLELNFDCGYNPETVTDSSIN